MKRAGTVLSALASLLPLLPSRGAMPASASVANGFVSDAGDLSND